MERRHIGGQLPGTRSLGGEDDACRRKRKGEEGGTINK